MPSRSLPRVYQTERDPNKEITLAGSIRACGDWVKNLQEIARLVEEHLPHLVEESQLHPDMSETCEWCGTDKGRLVRDHCHGCGRLRGSLCKRCNLLDAHGWTIDGWSARCEGQEFYFNDWQGCRDLETSPQHCGATDAYALALKAWWREQHPELWWLPDAKA